MVSIIILYYYIIILKYYNFIGPQSYMRSVVDRDIVMQRIPVVTPGYLHVDKYPRVIKYIYMGILFYLTICNSSLGPLRVQRGSRRYSSLPWIGVPLISGVYSLCYIRCQFFFSVRRHVEHTLFIASWGRESYASRQEMTGVETDSCQIKLLFLLACTVMHSTLAT
jgi:hypothetical protein